jgi:hypothetical protein
MEFDHEIDSAFSQIDVSLLIYCQTFCGVIKTIPKG